MNTIRFTLPLLTLLGSLPAQRLIAVDSSRALSVVDVTSGSLLTYGQVSGFVGTPSGLARNPATNTTWVVSTSTDSLYTLDFLTGTAVLVGAFGNPAIIMHGLEYDSRRQALFGASAHDGGLYRIDPTTGAAALIGLTGLPGALNLAYDERDDVLFLTSTGSDALYTVDRATGAVSWVGSLGGPPNVQGLAYDRDLDVLWAVDNVVDRLYAIDQATGLAVQVGTTAGNLLGLLYIPGGNGSIVRHAHGCGPTVIATTGTPRVGGEIRTQIGNFAGVPVIGLGLTPGATPFCICTVGHEWSVSSFGDNHVLAIPPNAGFSGFEFAVQGAVLFAPGGCPAPAVSFSDTLVVTIG